MSSRPDQASALDEQARAFDRLRPRLFGVAYRMLGEVAEAEDVVQDAWLRWQRAERGEVRDMTGFLVTTVTRLAINVATSARSRRESYAGPWLPEPVDTTADPALGAERDEALHLAVLLMMERLSPLERAAYVLREAFDYPYPEIAGVIGRNEAATRQLVRRAREHIMAGRRAGVAAADHRPLLEAFVGAARAGDMATLERILAADVVSHADGNGMPGVARRLIAGRDRVLRLLAGVRDRVWGPALAVRWVHVNGEETALLERDGEPFALLAVEVDEDRVTRLLWVMAPTKLAGLRATGRDMSQDPTLAGP